uniref:Helicase n=1 Tax=Bacillus phage KoopaTroopa TaxID=3234046 RepID=A0AB39C717_9CAUD
MMMKMKNTEEMLDYLKVLSGLNKSGFRCEKEIMDVVGLLHGTGFGFSDGKAYRDKRHNEIRRELDKQVHLSELKDKIADQGRLIRVTEKDRQIGKTTMLIDFSLRHDIPILVGHSGLIEDVKAKAIERHGVIVGGKISVFVGKYHEVMGRKLPNGVLIDCTVRLEDYMEIRKHTRIRGGFHHDKLFI